MSKNKPPPVINEEKKMKEIDVNDKMQIDREVGGCKVHLTFEEQTNSTVVKNVIYALTDVFEKRVMLNKGLI